MKASLAIAEENDCNISKFMALVKSYTEVVALTPDILNSFIEKIYVSKPERINGKEYRT